MDNFKLKKSLGQNFLIDETVSQRIAEIVNIAKDDTVIEIGPGTGALTKYLVPLTDNLTCIEIDKRAVNALRKEFPKLNILNEDILKVNLDKLLDLGKKVKIIGNLPYYISSQIIFKLLDYSPRIDTFTFMIQRELANRIVSEPNSKEYGILTLAVKMCGTSVKRFDVPPTAFKPPPKVTSSVVTITFNDNKFDWKLHNFIKSCFNSRRKKLSNSIKSHFNSTDDYQSFISSTNMPIKIKEMLDLRAENLTLSDFYLLYENIKNITGE